MMTIRLFSEGPNLELAWLLYLVGGFFLLAILIGWVSSAGKQKPAEAPHETHGEVVKREAVSVSAIVVKKNLEKKVEMKRASSVKKSPSRKKKSR